MHDATRGTINPVIHPGLGISRDLKGAFRILQFRVSYPEAYGVSDPLHSWVKCHTCNKFGPNLSLKKAKTRDPRSSSGQILGCVSGSLKVTLTWHFCQQRPSEALGLPQNSSGPLMSFFPLIWVWGGADSSGQGYSRIRLPGMNLCPTAGLSVIMGGPLPTFPGFSVLVYEMEDW